MNSHFGLQRILRHDNAIVFACLIAVIAVSWGYILTGAGMSTDMSEMMLEQPVWDFSYTFLMFFMWWFMMIAMMLPSAAPMILLFAFINRKNAEGANMPVVAFVFAYILVWGAFCVFATALQWVLQESAMLSHRMVLANPYFGGTLLIAAGLWQLSPFKHACLRHCRAPLDFFAHGWRKGVGGAFQMGLSHGAFCLDCCWVMMLLLFYGGVMNLWWIAGLAAYVLIEKTIPAGHWIGQGVGVLLALWGGGILYLAS